MHIFKNIWKSKTYLRKKRYKIKMFSVTTTTNNYEHTIDYKYKKKIW